MITFIGLVFIGEDVFWKGAFVCEGGQSGKRMIATSDQMQFKFVINFIQDGSVWVKELRNIT